MSDLDRILSPYRLGKDITVYTPNAMKYVRPYKPSPEAADILLNDPSECLMGQTDCPDECEVEPDGHCPHGYESAALTLGVI